MATTTSLSVSRGILALIDRPFLLLPRFCLPFSLRRIPCHALRRRSTTIVCCASEASPQQAVSHHRWQPFRKKKVVMRVGYVGTDYRGLQLQRDAGAPTIEGELQAAIFKAGGILDSNYGNLYKIAWARSSRTDKGVHSLATTISLKMEIPEDAWNNDPHGIRLAKCINHHLPNNIKVFGILPSTRSFDARRECVIRKYAYLVPAEVIGITHHSSAEETDYHLTEFSSILKVFEGVHPFHNYTIRSIYRKGSRSLKRVALRTRTSDGLFLDNEMNDKGGDCAVAERAFEERKGHLLVNGSDEERAEDSEGGSSPRDIDINNGQTDCVVNKDRDAFEQDLLRVKDSDEVAAEHSVSEDTLNDLYSAVAIRAR